MVVPGLTVLIPHDGTRASAEKLRRWYAEKIKPNAAVWSIEYGRHGTGYHLNIIADLVADLAPANARVLASPIRTNVRATAAYITKRSQTPPADNIQRRNTGYMGKLADLLLEQSQHYPIINAAALQTALTRDERAPGQMPATPATREPAPDIKTAEQIARKHLARLLHINEQLNGAPTRARYGTINCTTPAPHNPPTRYI